MSTPPNVTQIVMIILAELAVQQKHQRVIKFQKKPLKNL